MMPRTHTLFAITGLLSLTSAAFASDEAKRVVKKGIQAHGGEAKLAKLRMREIQLEGTIAGVLGQRDTAFKSQETWDGRKRYRSEMSVDGRLALTVVINAEKVWVKMYGEMLDLCKDYAGEIKASRYARSLEGLDFLNEKETTLSALGETKVGSQIVVGVLVKSNGHREVSLYFDKVSGLLVKREFQGYSDAAAGMVVFGTVFLGHQEKDGIKHYTRIVEFQDGVKTCEARVTGIRFFERIDARLFSEP